MPKILCDCVDSIPLGAIPSSNQYLIISDVDFEPFFELKVNAEDVYAAMKLAAKCPECGRLHIFWDGFHKPGIVYKVEE
jgi:hypothetical protein